MVVQLHLDKLQSVLFIRHVDVDLVADAAFDCLVETCHVANEEYENWVVEIVLDLVTAQAVETEFEGRIYSAVHFLRLLGFVDAN